MKSRMSYLRRLQRTLSASTARTYKPVIGSFQSQQNFIARPSQRTYASISAAELQFGQPVHETHPHLLKAGESKDLDFII